MSYITKEERECLVKNLETLLDTPQKRARFMAKVPIANKRFKKIMRTGACTYQEVKSIADIFGLEQGVLIEGVFEKLKKVDSIAPGHQAEGSARESTAHDEIDVTEATESLQKNITELIARSGLSQKAFADKIGISDSVVSQMRTGKQKKFRWTTIEAIARKFGISSDDLLNGDAGEAIDRKEAEARKPEPEAPAVSNLAFYGDVIAERANELMESTGHPAATCWCAALHTVLKEFGENISSPEDVIGWLEAEHHEEVIEVSDTEKDLIRRYRDIDPSMEFGKTPLEALRGVGMFGEIKSDMTVGYVFDHLA